jgi:hypothetical protein
MVRAMLFASIAAMSLVAALPAEATLIRFAASLSPANETPPVMGSSGTGFVVVDYDDAAHTLLIQAQWSNLTGTSTVAHIHCCALPTTTAAVAVTPGTLPNFPVGLTSGSYTSPLLDLKAATTFTAGFVTNFAGGVLANAESALIANILAGRAYFNIHSSFVGSGEIRGTLQVPEPGVLPLLAVGLLGLVIGVRRRRNA